MPAMGCTLFFALSCFAGGVAAQVPQQIPQGDARSAGAAPSVTQQATTPGQRTLTPSKNQFFSPVMGVDIEGQGLALPKGLAEPEIPAKPAPQPQEPAPTPK